MTRKDSDKSLAPTTGSVETTSPAKYPQEEESAHSDDAVIGRAFRWSLFAIVAIASVAGGIVWYKKSQGPSQSPQVTPLSAPSVPAKVQTEIPGARFTDVTAAAGIDFVHYNGAYGDKLLPETMGGGVAFLDFDNDGDQDLLLVNGTDWTWKRSAGGKLPTMALYRNDGKGHFDNVTASSGLDTSLYGMGVAIGDYDNDAAPDIFIAAVGENRLFHNDGHGKFTDVTASAGVGGLAAQWSTSAAWIDYDNDGDLDLFVCNYVKWSREIDFEVDYRLVGIGRAYGPPMNFAGSFPYLYRNDGKGKFTDVSKQAGIQVTNAATGLPVAKSLAVAPVDVDNDGWIDL